MNRAISWLRMTWQVLSNPKRRTGEGGRYTLFREPSADSPRDLVVHGHWMAGIVLSEGFATRRLPQLLRAALRHCGDVLREHGVALTLIDQGWMPRPWEMKDKFDLMTSNFTYVRWFGGPERDREKRTTWDKVIVDRQGDLSEWVSLHKKVQERRIMILAFANNHYAFWTAAHKRSFLPLPCSTRMTMRLLSIAEGVSAMASEIRRPAA